MLAEPLNRHSISSYLSPSGELKHQSCSYDCPICSAQPSLARDHAVTLSQSGRKLVPKVARLADQNDAEFFGGVSAEDLLRTPRRHSRKSSAILPTADLRVSKSISGCWSRTSCLM